LSTVKDPVVIHKGLDNVYVSESKICFIDGEASRLFYRGYGIEDLTDHSTFEETVYLLLYGWLPTKDQLEKFTKKIENYRVLHPSVLRLIHSFPKTSEPMDVLRTVISSLALYDPQPLTDDMDQKVEKCLQILAQTPTMIAAFDRIRNGKEPIQPKPGLSHAADFLYMLTGNVPDPYDVHVMDIGLILHAEHEMNASTFSCIVTASTLADMYSVLTSGVGTLRGPLHGGANEEALKAVQEVGEPSKAETYVVEALSEKRRIMGFGHRVYKNFDPRYKIFKSIGAELAKKKGQKELFETAVALENSALSHLAGASIFPNVDSYSGVVFHILGIRTDLFTPIFVMSRIAGWTAHVIEYLQSNRLIRPKALYVGEIGLRYVPIEYRRDEVI
jgi:citrate synthase